MISNFKNKYYPKGDVTQYFGENPELYQKAIIINGTPLQAHNGIDIVRAWGTPILSPEDAKVVEAKLSATGYGKHVRTITESGREWTFGHLSEIRVVVGQEVKRGEVIGLMGNTGFVVSETTPYWKVNPYAGTHLHLGVRIFTKWVRNGDKYNLQYSTGDRVQIEDYDNGYFGAVDPIPVLKELSWISDEGSDTPPEALKQPVEKPLDPEVAKQIQLTIISVANQVASILRGIIRLKSGNI